MAIQRLFVIVLSIILCNNILAGQQIRRTLRIANLANKNGSVSLRPVFKNKVPGLCKLKLPPHGYKRYFPLNKIRTSSFTKTEKLKLQELSIENLDKQTKEIDFSQVKELQISVGDKKSSWLPVNEKYTHYVLCDPYLKISIIG